MPVPEAGHQLLAPGAAGGAQARLQAAVDGSAAALQRHQLSDHQESYGCGDRQGLARILVLNRPGADERRDRLLESIPTRPGFDRDEYPPAVGRGRANANQKGLVRGINPIGWLADVMYVPSSENRSHGSSLGAKLRGLCNGVRLRYVFVS